MEMLRDRQCVAFSGKDLIAEGNLLEVALATKQALDKSSAKTILLFDDESRLVEIDFRGTTDALLERIKQAQNAKSDSAKIDAEADLITDKAKPGRPKLGVVAREVTLLPRHWEWLNAQPGGASVTIRKLVEAARKGNSDAAEIKKRQEIAYRFMSAMAGDEVGFEQATRALFANDAESFEIALETWPTDVKSHARKLAKDLLALQ